jgi:perosamine synthetase
MVMSKFIPLSVPNLKGNELQYVSKAIETEWVSTGGGYIDEFERNIASYLKVETAVACQSGTAGLHLALELSGVSIGEEVIVPTLTFIAAVNPVRYTGAEPVFMDCDDSLNMDLDKLEAFCRDECTLTDEGLLNKHSHRLIRAVVIVHVFGNMVDMDKLMHIAAAYHLKVVEDATEALGTYCTSGRYNGKFAGTVGDFGVYSFNGNKIITTGGGGMLVASDSAKAEKARYLSTQAKDDELYYIHHEIGYNYRMTNLQAALGVAQLEQLESFIQTKQDNYTLYQSHIDQIEGLALCKYNANTRPNYWLNTLVVDDKTYSVNRDALLKVLAKLDIQTRPVWGLIHLQKPYLNSQSYLIEKAIRYSTKLLNIPSSSNLETADVDRIASVLSAQEFLKGEGIT